VGLLLPVAMTRAQAAARSLAAAAISAFCGGAACAQGTASAPSVCPQELARATQLLLVPAKDMSARAASLIRFERASAGTPWKRLDEVPVVLGWAGTRWAWNTAQAKAGQGPVKKEGDGATPAGIFPLGAPFGSGAASYPGYVRLIPGRQFCVSEPQSLSYNAVADPRPAGLKGEDMGAVSLYRRGLFIEFPTSRAARGGSCLFIHVWRSPSARTEGCVAASEENVAVLQGWVRPRQALIAILPQEDAQRLGKCIGLEFGEGGMARKRAAREN
jgi:L,D-peptidoglycan transpeptidase YkuD (ErfK/YbiS/YcfS/YnhG family)